MKTFSDISALQSLVIQLKNQGKSIGFIPTMGFLHEGHLSLIKKARKENDIVIVSIFVNSRQFGPNEDFNKYPRNIFRDKKLIKAYCDYLFLPSDKDFYKKEDEISFQLDKIGEYLCGKSRPRHFIGVLIVMLKLLNIVQPHHLYMGQKDYQQCIIIHHLLREFFLPVQLVICPTIREKNGLALSSRNVYLNAKEQKSAKHIYEALKYGLKLLHSGEKKTILITQKIKQWLLKNGIKKIDYVEIRDADNLKQVLLIKKRPVVLLIAVFIGETRLIDNILFHPITKL